MIVWFFHAKVGHRQTPYKQIALPEMVGRFCKSHLYRCVTLLTVRQNGSLAQLVEQRTLNPFVAGSIPARPTK